MDPNVTLPDEVWMLIMKEVAHARDKWNLENASARLQVLFRKDNTNWLLPLVLPILMKYSEKKYFLKYREISLNSCLLMDEYADKLFRDGDLYNFGYENLAEVKLCEQFHSITKINYYLEKVRLSSRRTPRLVRQVILSFGSYLIPPEDKINLQTLQILFKEIGSHLEGVHLIFPGFKQIRKLFEIIFANCPKLERIIFEVCTDEDISAEVLPFPPSTLHSLVLCFHPSPTPLKLTSQLSFKNVFSSVKTIQTFSNIFHLSHSDLAFENLETLDFNYFFLNAKEGRGKSYEGLVRMKCPKLRKISFSWSYDYVSSKGILNEGWSQHEISDAVKKTILTIMRFKFPHRLCSTSSHQLIQNYSVKDFFIISFD